MKLTSHDRIMRIFQNKELDRPALKLWGATDDPYLLHPAYRPVRELAGRISDLFIGYSLPFNIYCGQKSEGQAESFITDTDDPTFKDNHIVFHTPKGDLHGVERISTVGEPSYTTEHMIKEPEDIEKLLSMEYEPFDFKADGFFQRQRQIGDRGVVLVNLYHAGYSLQCLIGSENMAFFSIDCRDKLERAIGVFSDRIREFVKSVTASGIRAPFQWVGPEVFIPPLMSPRDFTDFIYKYDKPLCDDIHNAGGYVWVHSHGKVANFIEQYIAMGVDVLNPLEPPKNGDINLESIIDKYSNRIGWEGNIEIQEIIQAKPERLKDLIHACVSAGNKSGRFILCPSAGYMEYPFPAEQYIDNLLLYLQYGFECVERCRTSG
ncbi:MAG: uroporphyrinogen decarboxylase family protein [Eubacteriales bacterium]|nr:uroporphyrinogen decarboxylase family protein [Eubacteriales bacterium]